MNRCLLILALLGGSVAGLLESAIAENPDYPLTAVIGIGRGQFPGQYVTELRIGHTVYVSHDACRKASPGFNERYPARVADQTVWLLVGSTPCKYHIFDEHPFMAHTPRVD